MKYIVCQGRMMTSCKAYAGVIVTEYTMWSYWSDGTVSEEKVPGPIKFYDVIPFCVKG